jgi:hypothetical protein
MSEAVTEIEFVTGVIRGGVGVIVNEEDIECIVKSFFIGRTSVVLS